MSDYKQLRVWREARELSRSCYDVTRTFPAEERYGLQGQIRRAAVSIAANIAEGSERRSHRDFVRFLRIARGSASELECLVLLGGDVGMISTDRVAELEAHISRVRRMLAGLTSSIQPSSRHGET